MRCYSTSMLVAQGDQNNIITPLALGLVLSWLAPLCDKHLASQIFQIKATQLCST